nr:MAG TPA: toxin [Bacteriophage sp.]
MSLYHITVTITTFSIFFAEKGLTCHDKNGIIISVKVMTLHDDS